MQNAFRMAPPSLRTILDYIPGRIKKYERFRQNRPVDDANFQLSLHDFSDDMRDLGLSFCRNLAPSIGFRGLEAQVWESSKKYQTSADSIDFETRHLDGRLFTFCPDRGECFAPYQAHNRAISLRLYAHTH